MMVFTLIPHEICMLVDEAGREKFEEPKPPNYNLENQIKDRVIVEDI